MEPLLAQLKTLPQRLLALPLAARIALASAIVVGVGAVAAARLVTDAARWQYVFTQLSPADSAACADALKAAGVPFRVESNGEALAVPEARVHDARLLLAGQGLPRGAGVGFELFDKGDLGVSEFTQRVNLQRAIEGELARTIQSLGPVQEARVHLSLPKKGLFRDEDKSGQGAVMVRLHPGRTLDERALAGVRHLVASAVPGLSPSAVTIVDDKGTLLGADVDGALGTLEAQKRLERSLEERIVAVLEPQAGAGAVVARVTATLDDSEEGSTSSVYDPDRSVLRSERTVKDEKAGRSGLPEGIVGAAANAALEEPGSVAPNERSNRATREESTRNYEVTGTVTRRTTRSPRLTRLSVAVVVDERGPTPRTKEEIARLTELARRAVGFDEDRGDLLELTSVAFVRPPSERHEQPTQTATGSIPAWWPAAVAAAAALLVIGGVTWAARRRAKARAEAAAATAAAEAALIRVGADAAALAPSDRTATEEERITLSGAVAPERPLTPRERAIALALAEPRRAAQVLEAWLEEAHDMQDPMTHAPAPEVRYG